MPGCVLKIYGPNFDVARYLAEVSLTPNQIFEIGKPIRYSNERQSTRIADESGFHCIASKKSEFDFDGQVEEAITFLDLYFSDLQNLSNYTIQEAYLDFAVRRRKGVALQRESLPVDLLRKASSLNFEIVISLMPGEQR